jgi:hypothetical protein
VQMWSFCHVSALTIKALLRRICGQFEAVGPGFECRGAAWLQV